MHINLFISLVFSLSLPSLSLSRSLSLSLALSLSLHPLHRTLVHVPLFMFETPGFLAPKQNGPCAGQVYCLGLSKLEISWFRRYELAKRTGWQSEGEGLWNVTKVLCRSECRMFNRPGSRKIFNRIDSDGSARADTSAGDCGSIGGSGVEGFQS